ncbi:unnamed protein product [Phyllotreta striolata]|uniref:Nuclear receptor domain-containing protein n=1 Tax=Phyllotreta striolata TaxID=444603 RepID=A0A9N9TJX4_PHYSR|nr:unnamed protein product [Phyllotreta striolata]
MNQTCKVCGEPAAGFHFGAFTCEGCKSFFGRSYNNLSSISECKNNGECVINKKNRTACKACRLRKCLLVGMSKSGSRYGRRSNWFKIHCLLQEQQQQQQQQQANMANSAAHQKPQQQKTPPLHHHHHHHHQGTAGHLSMGLLGINSFPPPLLHLPKTKEELMLLGLDECNKYTASPSVSSPESHNSDSSVEVSDARRLPYFPGLLPPAFLPPPGFLFPPGYPPLYPGLLQPANNNKLIKNRNHGGGGGAETFSKRVFLDAVLQSQRSPTPDAEPAAERRRDDDDGLTPIDLSMKAGSERSSPARSATPPGADGSDADEESDCASDDGGATPVKRMKLVRPAPLDLTTKA